MKKLKTRAVIDLEALKNNFRIINEYIHSHSPECDMICVVKADAYGHSAELCIPALAKAGAEHFAVSCIDEATSACEILKKSGCSGAVFILGPTDTEYVGELARLKIIQAVPSLDYARELQAAAEKANVTVDVAIKLDTGMNRIGFPADDSSYIADLCQMQNLNVLSLFTHFACADEPNDKMTQAQYAKFLSVAQDFKRAFPCIKLQCCNSAAAVRYPEMHHDLVRVGLILYGLFPSQSIALPGLVPVLTLTSTVTHIHTLKKGESISYGATYTADCDINVATVGIGYGDGFLRACAKDGYLIINGKKAKILGRICMDQCMVDITDIDVRVGDDAVVFDSDGKNTEALAKAAGTINYELLCLLSPRVKRISKQN